MRCEINGQNGNSRLEILSIGTGGENQVRYASIATGDGHAAGGVHGLGFGLGKQVHQIEIMAAFFNQCAARIFGEFVPLVHLV